MSDDQKNDSKENNEEKPENTEIEKEDRGYFLFAYEHDNEDAKFTNDLYYCNVAYFTNRKDGNTLAEVEEKIRQNMDLYPLNQFFVIQGNKRMFNFKLD